MSGTGAIHVVATVNLTRAFGAIRHVTPITGPTPLREVASSRTSSRKKSARAADPSLALRLYSRGGRGFVEFPVPFIPDACRDAADDETGVVDALLPSSKNAARLELVLNGSVVDTFVPGATAAVRDIRQAPRKAGRRTSEGGDVEGADDPVLMWRTGTTTARKSRTAAAAAGPTYTVQISTDEGQTWTTAGFALREPQVRIDRHLIGDADTVRVRVTSTNGFASTSTERTMKVSDL
jgi:hypothetical protein